MKKYPETDKKQRLELYSPQMRRIFTEVPNSLTFWLVAVSLLIIICVTLILVFMPYPHGAGESLLGHILGRG